MVFKFQEQPKPFIHEDTVERETDLKKIANSINQELTSLLATSSLPFCVGNHDKPIPLTIKFSHFHPEDKPRVVKPKAKLKQSETIVVELEIDDNNRFRKLNTSEKNKLFEDSLRFALGKINKRRELATATQTGDELKVATQIAKLLEKSFATKQLRKAEKCHTIDDFKIFLANSIFKTLDRPQLKQFLISIIKQIMIAIAKAAHKTGLDESDISKLLATQFDDISNLDFNRTTDVENIGPLSRYMIDKTTDISSRSAKIESLKQQIINDIIKQLN